MLNWLQGIHQSAIGPLIIPLPTQDIYFLMFHFYCKQINPGFIEIWLFIWFFFFLGKADGQFYTEHETTKCNWTMTHITHLNTPHTHSWCTPVIKHKGTYGPEADWQVFFSKKELEKWLLHPLIHYYHQRKYSFKPRNLNRASNEDWVINKV